MATFQVKWSKDPREPRSSYWHVLGGKITYASGALKEWTGKSHYDLAAHLYLRGFHVKYMSKDCVPRTQKFHKELLQSVDALLSLLNQGEKNG